MVFTLSGSPCPCLLLALFHPLGVLVFLPVEVPDEAPVYVHHPELQMHLQRLTTGRQGEYENTPYHPPDAILPLEGL